MSDNDNSVAYARGFSDGCDVQRVRDNERIAELERQLVERITQIKNLEEMFETRVAELDKLKAEIADVRQKLIDELAKNALTPTGIERLVRLEADLAKRDGLIVNAYTTLLPNYAFTDTQTAIDLIVADSMATRTENERLRMVEREHSLCAEAIEGFKAELAKWKEVANDHAGKYAAGWEQGKADRQPEINGLQKEIKELREGLRKLEWIGPFNVCPVCDMENCHAPDCWLAALLEQK